MIRTQYGTLRETWEIPTGTYFRREWPVVDPTNVSNELSIAGWTAKCQIRERPDITAPVLFEWSTSPGTGEGVITLVTGLLAVEVIPDDTADWTFRRAWYDVVLTDPDAHPTRLVEGRAQPVYGVTY